MVIWGWRNIGVLGGCSVRSFIFVDCSAELIGIYIPPLLLVCPFSFDPAVVGSREVCRSHEKCLADYLLISSNVVYIDKEGRRTDRYSLLMNERVKRVKSRGRGEGCWQRCVLDARTRCRTT